MIYHDAKVELEYALYKPLNLPNDLIIHILARHEFFFNYMYDLFIYSHLGGVSIYIKTLWQISWVK